MMGAIAAKADQIDGIDGEMGGEGRDISPPPAGRAGQAVNEEQWWSLSSPLIDKARATKLHAFDGGFAAHGTRCSRRWATPPNPSPASGCPTRGGREEERNGGGARGEGAAGLLWVVGRAMLPSREDRLTDRMLAATQTILCPVCRAPNRGDARFCQQCGNDVLLDNNHGDYRILKIIKEGGMGTVYRGIDNAGTEYAIKEMHDRFATTGERQEGIKHFEEEAALLQKLRHPAVPHVYRSFIDEGRYYLAMEFIHGEDLEDLLKREGHIDEPTALRWADQLCDVLEYMHSQGLIYRDMKPSNIMITREGNVKLIDFGIAKLLQPGQRNTMVGTPGYSPPEQYQGLATAKSDIYALAATLHHVLTGRDPRDHPPFSFPLASEINPAISPQTAGALAKALSMDEEHRFQTMDAFRRALPIPTGDRSPTLPFDLPRDTRKPSPRSFPATQPPRAAQPQPLQPRRDRSRASPITTYSRRVCRTWLHRCRDRSLAVPVQRRGGGFRRFVRRVVSTAVLLAVLTGIGEAYRPDIVNPDSGSDCSNG